MDYKSSINELMKYYRSQKGLSQADLAEKSGVSIQAIKQIESPTHTIKAFRIDTLFRLCKGLGISPVQIIAPLWKIYTGQAKTILEVFEKEED